MLDATSLQAAANALWAARTSRTPIDPLTERFAGIDVVDAYEIQLLNIRRQLEAGASVRGHKVGLSSPVMQYCVSGAEILVEAGKRKLIGVQEDQLIEIAVGLAENAANTEVRAS